MNDGKAAGIREDMIHALLSRKVQISAVSALIGALRPELSAFKLRDTAVVIDSSAFLRLGDEVEIVDYLNTRHTAPIIIPGQSIQEFWNNQLNVIDTIASGIEKKFEALRQEIEKIDGGFSDFSSRFLSLTKEFRQTYGYIYDRSTRARTLKLLDFVKAKAITTYINRNRFDTIASQKKVTRTPPGFADVGFGDFYIWVDTLDAPLLAKDSEMSFNRVVLITNDRKLDWSRNGIPHPILSAEIGALFGVPFETWDVKQFVIKVAADLD